ncbi:T9SS type A sorting domain-containing protein [Mariniphaga sp.]|uniref:T9SS type A sorting domain-containing protein n=1 Tax=Mariniphaga sp. TaxID=1954475 RepID=UPI0035687DCD
MKFFLEQFAGLFFLSFLLLMLNTSNAQSWSFVGPKAFSAGEAFNQSITVIGETPYVAYMDRANNDKATVKKFDGENWVPVGTEGFTEGKVISLKLSASGDTPYVAFCDEANGKKASVMKFDGADWVYVGPAGFTENIADVVSFVISGGIPWIAFSDAVYNSKITVMKYSGGWTTVGVPGFSTGFMTNVIALDVENGIPYVAYRDYGANYKVSAMKFNTANSSWELLGTEGFSTRTHDAYHCIAIHNGTPYVASWGEDAKAALYKFDGTNWLPVGSGVFSAGQANYLTVKIANNGTPYVVFSDHGHSKKATLMRFTESTWEMVGEPASQGEATYTDFAFSESGIPYLVFRDGYSMRRTTVMKYDLTSSVSEKKKDETNLKVYPNPGNGAFTFELPEMVGEKGKLEVTDLSGRIIFNKHIVIEGRNKVTLPVKKSGIYNMSIITKGSKFTESLLIKE